jgi:RNA polymerase subunit RPABC4/transcription elongation factor Spt4
MPAPDQRICRKCGTPAPDAGALFCNKCGTGYKKEPEIVSAACPRCGYALPDDQSQFCNRCGAAVGTQLVNKKPACKKCGAVAPDEETLFCNRCGTSFNSPASSFKTVNVPETYPVQPVSVKISKKKPAPVAITPEDLWDTVPVEQYTEPYYPPPVTPPVSPMRKKYGHLPLVADEFAGGKVRDECIDIPQTSKKYGHLPLIADELKEKQSPRLEIESPYYPGPPKERKAGKPKKGFFDLLKK